MWIFSWISHLNCLFLWLLVVEGKNRHRHWYFNEISLVVSSYFQKLSYVMLMFIQLEPYGSSILMWSSLGWKRISSSLTCKKTCFSSSADTLPDQSSANLFTCSCFNTANKCRVILRGICPLPREVWRCAVMAGLFQQPPVMTCLTAGPHTR